MVTNSASKLRPGYTIDGEGRLNIYAIEPEMYIKEPGDLRRQQAEAMAQRRRDLEALQEDETWSLTMDYDLRHKGPGLI
uniref:Uncharacterized protein n=1 Tax=Cyanothece sp. (strain PCC 7425 / ATCC 29141) TaxID=395961 RepID=B8HNQ4_CYAP4